MKAKLVLLGLMMLLCALPPNFCEVAWAKMEERKITGGVQVDGYVTLQSLSDSGFVLNISDKPSADGTQETRHYQLTPDVLIVGMLLEEHKTYGRVRVQLTYPSKKRERVTEIRVEPIFRLASRPKAKAEEKSQDISLLPRDFSLKYERMDFPSHEDLMKKMYRDLEENRKVWDAADSTRQAREKEMEKQMSEFFKKSIEGKLHR